MKRERRQELRTNELAASLVEAREFFNKHGTYILAGLVVVALLFAVTAYVSHQRRVTAANEWAQLDKLRSEVQDPAQLTKALDSLEGLAADAENADVAQEALLQRGRSAEFEALKDAAGPNVALLDQAKESYQAVLDRFGKESMLAAGSALIRLANLEANYFAADFDPAHRQTARTYLERLRDDSRFDGTPFETEALARLNKLDETFVAVRIVEAPPPTPIPAGPPAPIPDPLAPPMPPLPDEALWTPTEPSSPADPDQETPAEPDPTADEPGADEPPADGVADDEPQPLPSTQPAVP